MNKLINWIKRMFIKKVPVLEETTTKIENSYSDEKENFIKSIKVENEKDNLLEMQKKLEENLIDENNLSTEQVAKIKELYHSQIINLIENIKKYKSKLKWFT